MSESNSNYKAAKYDWKALAYSLSGVVIAFLLWQFFTSQRFLSEQLSKGFSPSNTLHELAGLMHNGALKQHALPGVGKNQHQPWNSHNHRHSDRTADRVFCNA